MLKKLLICLLVVVGAMSLHIRQHNVLTEKRRALPALMREIEEIETENQELRFALAKEKSPVTLLHLLQSTEFSHLKFDGDPQRLTETGRTGDR